MKEYIVKYTWQKNPNETYMFVCMANDSDHASKQCVGDYPDCEVVSVDETNGDF